MGGYLIRTQNHQLTILAHYLQSKLSKFDTCAFGSKIRIADIPPTAFEKATTIFQVDSVDTLQDKTTELPAEAPQYVPDRTAQR